jgi:hypothetical protein
MSVQQRTERKPAYIPPITCKCGGIAMLIRTAHQPAKSGLAELRTFQCYICHDLTEKTVES